MLSKELSLLAAASFPLLVAQLPWPTRGLREEEKTLGRETGTPERRVETVVPPYAPPPTPGRERARAALGAWAASAGARLGALGLEMLSTAGICPIRKSAGCGVCVAVNPYLIPAAIPVC